MKNLLTDTCGPGGSLQKTATTRPAAVLSFANTLTSSAATRPDGRNEDLWWCCDGGSRGDTAVTGDTVQAPASGAGLGQADTGYGNGRGNGRMAGGGSVSPPAK